MNFKNCLECYKIFFKKTKYSQKQWNNRLFCSRKCAALFREKFKYRNIIITSQQIYKKCLRCQLWFSIDNFYYNKYKPYRLAICKTCFSYKTKKTKMIKIKYTALALQPIFTGSDEDTGTTKTLRREKVTLHKVTSHTSWFKTENSRRAAILTILEAVWRKIDFEGMSSMRRLKIYDEFSSKMLAATKVRTKFQFLNELCRLFNIRSLSDTYISDILQRFSDDELLNLVREEQQFLILLLREKRQKAQKCREEAQEVDTVGGFDLPEDEKEKNKKEYFDLKTAGRDFEKDKDILPLVFRKTFDRIPYISGNSIRGILRRVAMRDFCDRVGIKKLDKNIYHQLFTGGNITDSTKFEDITKREEYIAMCPMIGLFGSAIGNMTIEGELKVGAMRPLCREHNNGDASFHELLGFEFGTRRDDVKLERNIEIVDKNEKDKPQQMKYDYEVFIKGTRFEHQFICTSQVSLIKSAFYHLLNLFKDQPFIGGVSGVGNGEVELDYLTESDLNYLTDSVLENEYLEYLRNPDNRLKIQEYFAV